MSTAVRIVIVGAGMVGLTLAALLSRAGRGRAMHISVVDAGAAPSFDEEDDVALRVSALSVGTIAALQSVAAWNRIRETRACPYREMRVWDAADNPDGPDALHFDAAEHALPELGFIVENILVQSVLHEIVASSDVELLFGQRIEALTVHNGKPGLALQDAPGIEADLVIGADGASSRVREAAGIDVTGWNYGQKAFVTHVQPERPHEQTAWQRFLPSGPLGMLPLSDGRVSLVWSTTPQQAEAALAASDAELQSMLDVASDGVLGAVRPAAGRGAFPLRAQYADAYVKPGIALLGDAAHSIHPLAGQGANLGIADAVMLSEVILKALDDEKYPADLPVLRRYERARKGANQTMLRFVDGLNRLFAIDAEPLASLRSGGMQLFNRSGPLKRRAAQVALGIGR